MDAGGGEEEVSTRVQFVETDRVWGGGVGLFVCLFEEGKSENIIGMTTVILLERERAT